MARADRNPDKTYKWYQNDKYTQPLYKVTGKTLTGRRHIESGDLETQQLPPKYFNNKTTAEHYLKYQVHKGCLWKKNPEVGRWRVEGRRVNPRSQYIIETFKNIEWGQGSNLGYLGVDGREE